ncbi:MAG: PaaI family thioesterase [Candidatus Cloacimonetes bacterium]|nr:PaaI family thioesterase [Candidatus Cloacimonadota bacterium]
MQTIPDGFIKMENNYGFSQITHTDLYIKDGNIKDISPEFAVCFDASHQNLGGSIHGGVLVTYIDHVCAMAIFKTLEPQARIVTIQLNTNFISRGKSDFFIIAKPRIVRRTPSLLFVECDLFLNNRIIMSSSGIWKILWAN